MIDPQPCINCGHSIYHHQFNGYYCLLKDCSCKGYDIIGVRDEVKDD
jgi:hypothetical protein